MCCFRVRDATAGVEAQIFTSVQLRKSSVYSQTPVRVKAAAATESGGVSGDVQVNRSSVDDLLLTSIRAEQGLFFLHVVMRLR